MTVRCNDINQMATASNHDIERIAKYRRVSGFAIRQQGLVLVVVLWMIAMLSIIAGSVVSDGRAEIRVAINQADRWQAVSLAEAGIYRGIAVLAANARWPTSGDIQTLVLGQDKIRLAIYDESGRIDLNSADPTLLQGLVAGLGLTSMQQGHWLDVLADWKDPDSLTRLQGAEDDEYFQKGYRYGAKDGGFESVSELRQLLSMDDNLYRKLAPALTVHSLQRGVNPAVASERVLRTLPGVDNQQLQAYIQQRKMAWQMDGKPPKAPNFPRQLLTTESGHVFSLFSEGVTESGARAKILAMVRMAPRQQPPYSVLSWQQANWFPEDTKAE